jgi:Secretion system C-terminal sorting domain
MKKIILSLLSLVSLSGFAQTQRRVLMEELTNASCGPCASQNPNFNALLADNMAKVVQIKYQTVWPGTDPMNAQNQSDVAARVTKYAVSGVPFGVMDGDTNKLVGASYAGAPANATQALINTEYAIPSPFSMNMTYNYNAVTDSITSVVTITNATPNAITPSAAGMLKLEFALVEMNIKYATAPGSNGETEFYYVMRKMYPDANGTTLPNSIAAGQTLTYTFKEKAPSYIYKKEQMCVVGFIQDFGNNVVHQAAYGRAPNVLDIKCENTSTIASTDYCGATITPTVKITNKTNTTITSGTVSYTVNGTAGGSQPWTGSIANGASATVTMPAITAPIGSNIYRFTFDPINGGAVDIMESDNVMNGIATSVVGTNPALLNETFEANSQFDRYTAISLNNQIGLPSFVVTQAISTNATAKLGAYALSDKSFRYNFYNVGAGNRMGLIFYKNNMNAKGKKAIQFDMAYNHYIESGTAYYDTLSVKASIDCGKTWTEIWNRTGEDLRTSLTTPTTAAFYPKATEWRTEGATLGSVFENATELLIMFEGQSSYGNNLYIDNINFKSVTGVEDVVNNSNVSVYPNPSNNVVNVAFDFANATNAVVTLTDLTGKVIYTTSLNNITNNVHTIATSAISNGLYNLAILANGKTVNQKVTIAH